MGVRVPHAPKPSKETSMVHSMRCGLFSHLQDLVDEYLVGKHGLTGIEIGSYAGESAKMFLKSGAFDRLYCIDPWEPDYDTADVTCDDGLVMAESVFDKRVGDSPIVMKLKMKSSDAVNMFEDEAIDFIYIDGNHQYEFVKKDLEDYVPKIKAGGIISGHDYGGPTTPGVTKAVNEFFKKEPVSRYQDYSWVYIKN